MDNKNLSPLVGVLLTAGAPILARLVEDRVGGLVGKAGGRVIEALASGLGVEPLEDVIAHRADLDPHEFELVAQSVQEEHKPEWLAYLTLATAERNEMLEREDARESWFSWAWRPALSWLLMLLIVNEAMTMPVLRALGSNIEMVGWENIIAVSGIWLVIYGGGHTVKSVFGK